MENYSLKIMNYHQWANHKWFEHLKKLPEDMITQNINSVFPTLKDTLVHMLKTDFIWLLTITGKEYTETIDRLNEFNEKIQNMSLAGLEKQFDEITGQYLNFLNGIEDPQQTLTISHPKFGEAKAPLQDLIGHVVNHGTYHRGNLTAMLRQMGESGAATDYIFYLYEEQSLFAPKH
ncbi:DinB family protein [Fictibacillus fluitans]|uniref:DinB family protein n=1 Tax=Fictibacillus fluitans TaxID=3058422 RepID=A0ABT8I3D8_9BACL|nr:DinB family protein [Fictibacillus sp. NE201]MDN4527534.1 DinB family protein [Fictibacillus sp. NE201]